MTPKSFSNLRVSLGDLIRSVSPNTTMFTFGEVYEVEELDDGTLAVMTDCGFYAVTSSTMFEIVTPSAVVTEDLPVKHDVGFNSIDPRGKDSLLHTFVRKYSLGTPLTVPIAA